MADHADQAAQRTSFYQQLYPAIVRTKQIRDELLPLWPQLPDGLSVEELETILRIVQAAKRRESASSP